jgi:outer membrane lipoprotein-sorting protein
MKRPFYTTFLILLTAFFTLSLSAQDPRAKATLDAMSVKYQKMPAFKAAFASHLVGKGEKIEETLKGEITVKGDKYRLLLEGQEIFNDHKTVWNYVKESNEVTITHYDESDGLNPTEVFSMYKKGYKYLFVEEKTLAGKAHEIIELVPENKDLSFFKVRLAIDKKSKTLHSWEVFEKTGRRYRYEITNFTSNIEVKDSYFQFDVANYPKVEVIDLR